MIKLSEADRMLKDLYLAIVKEELNKIEKEQQIEKIEDGEKTE